MGSGGGGGRVGSGVARAVAGEVACSTLPSTMVPRSLYLERMGRRSGADRFLSSGGRESRDSIKHGPSYQGQTSPALQTGEKQL